MALKFNRFNNGQLVRDFSLVHSLKTMIWNGENGKNEKSFFSRAPTAHKTAFKLIRFNYGQLVRALSFVQSL